MIKTRLSSPALADRGARLAGVGFTERLVPRQVGAVDYEFPAARSPLDSQAIGCRLADGAHSEEPDRAVPAAEVLDLHASAAFSQFTESSCALRASDDRSCPCAPLAVQDSAPAVIPPSAGALTHTCNAILLPDHVMVLVRAIAAYERCTNERAATLALVEYSKMIGAGPLARAVADLCHEGDLVDVPERARFRGGGP